MFQDVTQILTKMGLKPTDSRIYMTLVSHKDGMFIAEICKITKIKRSTVYLSLGRLQSSGFVSQVKAGQRWKYMAEAPETLLAKQENLLEDLQEIVPFLSKLKSSDTQTEIKFFEGIDGIRKAYETVLIALKFEEDAQKKQLLAFASGRSVQKVFTNWQKQFINKRVRQRIPYKVILPKDSENAAHFTTDEEQVREARVIDEPFFKFKVMLEIYADSVFIYSPIAPVGGVIIRNANIADSLRTLHQFVWHTLEH